MSEYLVIAPAHPDLVHLPDEAAAIAEALPGKLLTGTVNTQRILDYIDERYINGIWIISHADQGSIQLSNDSLSLITLVGILNQVQAQWLVLATCNGDDFVSTIQRSCIVDVLAAEGEIPDKRAWAMGRLIAQAYDGDLFAAHGSVDKMGVYRASIHPQSKTDGSRMRENHLQKLEMEIENLQHTLYGNARIAGDMGLHQRLGKLERDMREVKRIVLTLQDRSNASILNSRFGRTMIYVIGVMTVLTFLHEMGILSW